MLAKALFLLSLLCVPLFAADGPKGTVPRTEVAAYPAHTQAVGVAIGAALLDSDQVKRTFVSDVSRCCMVVEVALYPSKDSKNTPLNVSLNDFVLRRGNSDVAVRPDTADLVAAMLHKKSDSGRTVAVTPSLGVGYQSGYYDPVTGPEAPGAVYRGGVNVATPRKSGSTDKDRKVMESELGEKGLPEGVASSPVSGYLYFPISGKKPCTDCQLEYTADGGKVVLPLAGQTGR
ncbi:MAG: hypothetical protein ABSE92_06200 [Terriglobales bacterium]|jgi:hypothetical protein